MGAVHNALRWLVAAARDCRSLVSLLIVLLALLISQLEWWYVRNGIAITGQCVNHFGEGYSCSLGEWLLRPLVSPFAWPALAIGCIGSWAALSIMIIICRKVFSPWFEGLKKLPIALRTSSRIVGGIIFGGIAIGWLYGMSLFVLSRR